jgi:uncharacterized protein YjbI with pentapeptide repeats
VDEYPQVYFICNEEARIGSKFCIFHDENYVEDHFVEYKLEASKRFEEKVNESISENKPLECIGYFLPAIEFTKYLPTNSTTNEKSFSQPVYFNKARFYEEVNFSGATFSYKVSFSRAKFSKEASFSRAKFSKEVDFSEATFSNEANFGRAKFSKEANFSEATFSNEADFTGATFFNEVRFTGATFSSIANTGYPIASFMNAKFYGLAYFGGATFSNKVYAHFTEATFFNEAYFVARATFSNEAHFGGATFSNGADFREAKFSNKAYFTGAKFSSNERKIYFNYTIFEQPNEVAFAYNDLSNVSFHHSDITRIRFGNEIFWGGRDRLTIIEEEWLKEKARRETRRVMHISQIISLEDVSSVYRNLRENYEFRLRYDDAGKFFIKEMELKRKYREAPAISPLKIKLRSWYRKLKGGNDIPLPNIKYVLIENGWPRRNLSLTGLYYHLSNYGESILKPTIIGIITIGLSTIFWLMQSDPTFRPSLSANNPSSSNISNFIWLSKFGDANHLLKSFERSFAGFIPLLPMGSEIKVGIIDYIMKIVGGALTFGLLAIALRRKFERKYTR